jgi:hypothetical protein
MSRNNLGSTLTRNDLQEAIQPLFLKVQQVETETRRSGILMERMNGKIDLALDVSKMVTIHEIMTKDHEHRLKDVEAKLRILHRHLRSKN